MKNIFKVFLFTMSSLIIVGGLIFFAGNVSAADAVKFTQEELVGLSKPSVVRIVQHVQGEAIFKPFSLDLDNLTITAGGGETRKIPIDEYMTGSGFIVSQDGYILTNSHVISNQQIRMEIIASVAQSALMDASLFSLNIDQEASFARESQPPNQ